MDQPIGVIVKIDAGVEWQRVSECEPLERRRQRIRPRHGRVVDEQRNNRNVAAGGVLKFQTNNVDRIINSARSIALLTEPARPDDGDYQTRALNCLFDLLPEINSWRN